MQDECDDCVSTPPLMTADESSDETGAALEVGKEESESEEEDSENEEEYDEIEEGCFVWAPFGRRKYPAQVVSLAAIPHNLHRQLMTKRTGQVYVKWIGEVDNRVSQKTDFFLYRLALPQIWFI